MNDCEGCRYENSTDIREHLSVCNYCQRAYAGEDRYYHDDRYEKRVTNADRIRAMDAEELADFLLGIDHYWDDGQCIVGFGNAILNDSKSDILEWLQSEAEGE